MLNKIPLIQKAGLALFGFCLAIIILEAGLRLGSFAVLSAQEYRNAQSIKQKGAYRIMCLGESTTALGGEDSYPFQLEEVLNQRSKKVKFSVLNKGIGGCRTPTILSELEGNLDKYKPEIVIAMMGINDYGSHMPYETTCPSKSSRLLKSFKVYKLTRLIWLHAITKLKESPPEKSSMPSQDIKKDELKEIAQLKPDNDFEYRETGNFYSDKARSDELERLCRKAIELKPDNDYVYIQLGWFCKDRLRFSEAEQLFKKAMEIKPGSDSAYIELGALYIDSGQGRFSEAEQLFKKAIELNPGNINALNKLGSLYSNEGRFSEAGELFKKAIKFDPSNDQLYGRLALIYSEAGDNELFEVYAEKANSLRSGYYDITTADNYRALKQILDKRKIKLVCAQYPVRNIAPLKKIFEKDEEAGIIFVDNEKIFKDAVRKEGYKEYFTDMFAGDFGHCTGKGNRLLAENIASAILKEVFNKK